MVEAVHKTISLRGETIEDTEYVNNNRNYIVVTNFRPYLVKWNEKPFYKAGELVPAIGKGMGLTVDIATFLEFRRKHKEGWVLFNWSWSDKIYYQHGEFVEMFSEPYEQYDGEWVRVINIRKLRPFTGILIDN